MKKKLYIVTCVNDENTCISANVFKTFQGASDALEAQYQAEREDAISCGWGEDDFDYEEIDESYAHLKYGSSDYYWEILEDEVDDAYAESAQKLIDKYANFDEKDTKQLLEDAMNLLQRIVDYSRVAIFA